MLNTLQFLHAVSGVKVGATADPQRALLPVQTGADSGNSFSGLLQQAAWKAPAPPPPAAPAPPRPQASATPASQSPAPAASAPASAPADPQNAATKPAGAKPSASKSPAAQGQTASAPQDAASASATPAEAQAGSEATHEAETADEAAETDERTSPEALHPLHPPWSEAVHRTASPAEAGTEATSQAVDEVLASAQRSRLGGDGTTAPPLTAAEARQASDTATGPQFAGAADEAQALAASPSSGTEETLAVSADPDDLPTSRTAQDSRAEDAQALRAARPDADKATRSQDTQALHQNFQSLLGAEKALAQGGSDSTARAIASSTGSSEAAGITRPGEVQAAGPLHAAGALAPTASTGPTTYAAAAAPQNASVGVPVDSPEFPQALASQISYLVREGVQEAQLHLNPAEMGPVSVHIALQGQQAQVDFAAASSTTRTALENSISDLAASLQSAGFTLTGGGVSQHPQQQDRRDGSEQATGSGTGRGHDGGLAPVGTAAPARAQARAGGLDLYA